GKPLQARVVETEAYLGPHDLASHASKGRTRRTEVLFGPAGRAYVYLIYGMYEMLNVVAGGVGEAQAVLIRAAKPLNSTVVDHPCRERPPWRSVRPRNATEGVPYRAWRQRLQ